jgi:hypothetical protein
MTDVRLTLFPELESWTKTIFSPKFIKSCTQHIVGLGYYSQLVKDEICIINSEGESSCTPGTLVGWRFVNDIEQFLSENGFPWFTAGDRSQEELAKGFTIAGQLANIISELIIKDGL